MSILKLSVTTPEGDLFKGEASQITVNTEMGEITILPNHIPLVSIIQPGELLIKQNNQEIPLAIYGGFIEIKNNNEVSILADAGEKISAIDEAKAEAAKVKAEEILKQKFNTADYEDAALNLQRELARLKIVRKYKHKGTVINRTTT